MSTLTSGAYDPVDVDNRERARASDIKQRGPISLEEN